MQFLLSIEKAQGHEWIRRTGSPGNYKYFYAKDKHGGNTSRHSEGAAVAGHEHSIDTASIKPGHMYSAGSGEGHYEVQKVEGDKVSFRPDDVDGKGKKGRTVTMSASSFKSLVEGSHGKAEGKPAGPKEPEFIGREAGGTPQSRQAAMKEAHTKFMEEHGGAQREKLAAEHQSRTFDEHEAFKQEYEEHNSESLKENEEAAKEYAATEEVPTGKELERRKRLTEKMINGLSSGLPQPSVADSREKVKSWTVLHTLVGRLPKFFEQHFGNNAALQKMGFMGKDGKIPDKLPSTNPHYAHMEKEHTDAKASAQQRVEETKAQAKKAE